MPSRPAVVAALLAVYVIWGSTYLALVYALATLPPFTMAGVRFVLAGAALLAGALASGAPRPSSGEARSAAIAGLGLLLLGNGGVVWAELVGIPSGVTALLVAMVPMWMALFEALLGDRPGRLRVAGLLVGFAGVFVLADPRTTTLPIGGVVALLLSTIGWSAGSLYAKRSRMPSNGAVASGVEMLAGGASMLAVGFLRGERAHVADVSAASAAALGYLAVFGSIVGFSAYGWLLKHTSPALASTYAFVNPVVAVLLGWLVAGEPVGPRTIASGSLIVAAVAMITLGRSPAPAPAPAPAPGR